MDDLNRGRASIVRSGSFLLSVCAPRIVIVGDHDDVAIFQKGPDPVG
jgi:hypothetical protein